MNILVTGATGFIGFHVAKQLREKGFSVRALVRSGSDASLLAQLDVEAVTGDIRDQDSVTQAAAGCKQIYHLAADYRIWVPDSGAMYETNVIGTRNVMQAALKSGVECVVYTSTVGLLPASCAGKCADENAQVGFGEMIGHYKKSKFLAEQEVRSFLNTGLNIVIVNPSTPIGAYDRKPTPTGRIFVDFLNGKIPAYLDTGLNIVDVEDVAAGHLLAARYGRSGERYILGNKNLTLREFLGYIAAESGMDPPKIRFPYLPILMVAYMNEALSRVTGFPPRIPVTGVKLARKYMYFDCTKAVTELHLPQSPIELAIRKAVQWFRENGYVHAGSGNGRTCV
jgi:dihydroflavonol-4-reductase